MARADLLLNLVKHALSGNKLMVRKVTEAIIAEERSKNHLVLAEKLEIELTHNALDFTTPSNNGVNCIHGDFRAENLITEIHPPRFFACELSRWIIECYRFVVDGWVTIWK